MRGIFVLSTTMGGAWMAVQVSLKWGALLTPDAVAGPTPLAGLFLMPLLLAGAIGGMCVGSLLFPRRY